MDIKEKVGFWIENAEYDLQTAEIMHNSARYAYTTLLNHSKEVFQWLKSQII